MFPSKGLYVYRIMEETGLSHRPNCQPNGITKADRNALRSDDLLKRDFTVEKPLEKCVKDITEIPARDEKLYVSTLFDCYDLGALGLAMKDKMKVNLCVSTIENAHKAFPAGELWSTVTVAAITPVYFIG